MARLNVEEQWWIDPRRDRLIELVPRNTADGLMLKVWRMSQYYWSKERAHVPLPVFRGLEHWEKIIEAGLAKVTECGDFVYVMGSSEHHEWLMESKSNGKTGGDERARRATRNYSGKFQPPTNPQPPTIQTSSSSSSSEKKNTIAQSAIARAYEIYPRKLGKTPGIKRLTKDIKNDKDCEDLILASENHARAMKGRETGFVPYFSTWVSEWRDWINPDSSPRKQIKFVQLGEPNETNQAAPAPEHAGGVSPVTRGASESVSLDEAKKLEKLQPSDRRVQNQGVFNSVRPNWVRKDTVARQPVGATYRIGS